MLDGYPPPTPEQWNRIPLLSKFYVVMLITKEVFRSWLFRFGLFLGNLPSSKNINNQCL